MKFFFLFLFITLIPNLVFSHSHYPITKDNEENVLKGKELYSQYCSSCHQRDLSGAANWKSFDEDGHRKAPPLNGTGHTWHHPDKQLHSIIKYGLAELVENYQGKMLGFGDRIDDKGIDNILSYIKSYWKEDIYKYQLEISKK